MRELQAAVGFLTRVPVGGAVLDARSLSRAALWFPVVGLLVGGAMAGTHRLAGAAGLDPLPATLLAVLVAVLVTGGLHEDGLADCADGFGAHVARERRLEILRDPRVGTYGALALVFAVATPLVALGGLDHADFAIAVLCAHVLARWSSVPQSWLMPPADASSSAGLVRPPAPVVAGATAMAVAVVLLLAGVADGLLALGVAVAVTVLGALAARRMLGGVTGDTLGAVNKLCELAVYLALGAALA